MLLQYGLVQNVPKSYSHWRVFWSISVKRWYELEVESPLRAFSWMISPGLNVLSKNLTESPLMMRSKVVLPQVHL